MKRRDIIIIGALVNVSVLALLFMLAYNKEDDKPIVQEHTVELTQIGDMKVEDLHNNADDFITTQNDISTKSGQNVAENSINDNLDYLEINMDEDLEDENPKKHEDNIIASSSEPIEEISEATEKKYIDVTVKKGDSLEKIAKNNGTTIKAIKDANNLKNDKLSIGKVLRIPVGAKKPEKQKKSNEDKTLASADVEWYTVKNGDNPWKIAKQFHIKVDDLLKLNNLNEEKAKNMKIGDKIRVK